MEDVAGIIADLVKEGVSPELIGRVAAALVSVTERNTVTRNVTLGVTPAAVRMRRMRERKSSENNVLDVEKTASVAVTERNGVTSQGVTSDNTISISSSGLEEEKKDIIVRSVTRKRNSYAQDFEVFWTAFPTDVGMSKLEASKAWEKLSPDDKQAATEAIPAFKAWAGQQGPNYRTVHACRYITQRRFDGFRAQAEKTQDVASNRVYVTTGTDAMDAWDDHYKRTKGKLAPRDQRGGWWFDSEFPPSQEKAA
jgi:hypothetical protein